MMKKLSIIEHSDAEKLIKNTEEVLGYVPVYQISIAGGRLCSEFAIMPETQRDSYYINDGENRGFLVNNAMDNNFRYHLVEEADLKAQPVFVGNKTPIADAMETTAKAQAQEEARRKEANESLEQQKQRVNEFKAHEFLTKSRVNSLSGQRIYSIADTLNEHLRESPNPSPLPTGKPGTQDLPCDRLENKLEWLDEKGISSKDIKSVPVVKSDYLRAHYLERQLDELIFEKEHGFQINLQWINSPSRENGLWRLSIENDLGQTIAKGITPEKKTQYEMDDFPEYPQDIFNIDFSNDSVTYFEQMGKPVSVDKSIIAELSEAVQLDNRVFSDEYSDEPSPAGFTTPEESEEGFPEGQVIEAAAELHKNDFYNRLTSNAPDVIESIKSLSEKARELKKSHQHEPEMSQK